MWGNAVSLLSQHLRRPAATALSDEQLLADYLARHNDEAFAALLGRHGPMVLNVCRRMRRCDPPAGLAGGLPARRRLPPRRACPATHEPEAPARGRLFPRWRFGLVCGHLRQP
jgi:hypothetical protein